VTTALDWLRPRPVTVPDGVVAEDVGTTAWQVLLHEGALRPVWGAVATPADRSPTPAVRAAALRPLVPPRAVLGWAAAVWVHTGGPMPDRFDVLVPPRGRRPSPHPLRVPHESPLPADDVAVLGPVRVTTVVRTALDVARWVTRTEAVPLLRRLADHAGLDLAAVARDLDAVPGQRFAERARIALAEAAGAADTAGAAEAAGAARAQSRPTPTGAGPDDEPDAPAGRDGRGGPQDVRSLDAFAGTPAALEPVIR
jgi:hypothetical protein